MVMLEDGRRQAIITELAGLKTLQELLIATEQKLMPAVSNDSEIRDRFNEFIKNDQENLRTIDAVIGNFGGGNIQSRDNIRQYIEQVHQLADKLGSWGSP